MDKIVKGIRTFQTRIFEKQRELFERLATMQQTPLALFITCSDSRINPNLITQTAPGELFILRNAGNIIPPYGAANGGEGATVEYAITVLNLENIIVCGHSRCGAMHHLMSTNTSQELPAVRAWFSHAEATRRIMNDKFSHLPQEQLEYQAIQQNVLMQIDNLRTHPSVAAALCRGNLNIYGWVYRLETGEVLAYDGAQSRFLPLTDRGLIPIPSPAHLACAPCSDLVAART